MAYVQIEADEVSGSVRSLNVVHFDTDVSYA